MDQKELKTCPECGKQTMLELPDNRWKCASCGYEEDKNK